MPSSMEEDDPDWGISSAQSGLGWKGKKRKVSGEMGLNRRKLLVGENVEVRFTDVGLRGSWNQGVVIGCSSFSRNVEYCDVLEENSTRKLVETIPISAAVEGCLDRVPKCHRGNIRPLPPHHDIDEKDIPFGMCVDALIDSAWWEGVIFDHEDGSPVRSVFFPDQGDEQVVGTENMRFTFDWNEVRGDWKLRGCWILVKFIQVLEKEKQLPISIKEIWYDVFSKVKFQKQIGEWSLGSMYLWRQLLTEVIKEATCVSHGENAILPVSFTQSVKDNISFDIISTQESPCLELSTVQSDDVPLPIIVRDGLDGTFVARTPTRVSLPTCTESSHDGKMDDEECSAAGDSSGMVIRPKDYILLDFLDKYHMESSVYIRSGKLDQKTASEMAKKLLFSMGWKIKIRPSYKCYVSPNGKQYTSLIKACAACATVDVSNAGNISGRNNKRHISKEHVKMESKSAHGDGEVPTGCFVGNNWKVEDIKAEYCPEALPLYISKERKLESETDDCNPTTARSAARKHLVALGWKVYVRFGKSADKEITRYLYCGPNGEKFYSLSQVCRNFMEEKESEFQMVVSVLDNDKCDHLDSEHLDKEVCCDLMKEKVGFQKIVADLDSDRCDHLDNEAVAVNCPEAILDYVNFVQLKRTQKVQIPKDVAGQKILKAKCHLLHSGWRIWHKLKNNRPELRYSSPQNKCFNSLVTACKAYIQENGTIQGTNDCEEPLTNGKDRLISLNNNEGSRKVYCNLTTETHGHGMLQESKSGSQDTIHMDASVSSSMYSLQSLEHSKLQPRGALNLKRVKFGRVSESSTAASCRMLQELGHGSDDLTVKVSEGSSSLSHYVNQEPKTLRTRGVLKRKRAKHGRLSLSSKPALFPVKKARTIHPSFTTKHVAQNMLSFLIDNKLVKLKEKVKYLNKRDGHVMREGWITRDGIKCMCCEKVFSISNFEVHAGSTYHRPSANIFLQDGRSLQQCKQMFMLRSRKKHPSHRRIKPDISQCAPDVICSICQDGGTLVLCDYCPSSFHLDCLGLEEVPEGKWCCPSCRCSICGLGEFNSDTENLTADSKVYCDHCECEFHLGCMRNKGVGGQSNISEGSWCCSEVCFKIFSFLFNLVGKSNPTSEDGLTWTILRSCNENDFEFNKFDDHTRTEHYFKLQDAVDVLHECFASIVEPRTNTDLVADLICNKESDLKRLNFWGFYTMILEKGEEIVSVATFRVFGDKAAEMPLIGTRIKYRRMGMCRVLVDELEKLLFSLGVKKLVLPAIPELLETWTTSFGFTKMTHGERLMLSEFIFLNFHGTTFCEKLLASSRSSSTIPDISTENTGGPTELSDMSIDETSCENLATVPEGFEMAKPVGEENGPREICSVMNSHTSSSLVSSLGTDIFWHDSKETFGERTAMNVASGKPESSSVLLGPLPRFLMMNSATDLDSKSIADDSNLSNRSTTTITNCISEDLMVKSMRSFKLFYKRRILGTQ